jgi:small-conductance mechanosensitive channel
VYFVLSADFNKYMDIQQAINMRLHREFAALGIEFAYPTQRLIIGAAPTDSAHPDAVGRTARSAA